MGQKQIQSKVHAAIASSPAMQTYIRKLSLFGSHLHGDATDESDIDLLVEFSEPVSYFEIIDMELDFKKHLGKKVDLVSATALSHFFRDDVLAHAQTLYEQKR